MMAEDRAPSDHVRSLMIQNIVQARRATASFFQLIEKSVSVSPFGETDQTNTFRYCVERNVAACFELSDKLLRAKEFQDVVRLQMEFFQKQLRALQGERNGDPAKMASIIRIPIK